MISLFRAVVLMVVVAASGCQTTAFDPAIPFGMLPGETGYIPARMVVLPCQRWPERASLFTKQPPMGFDAAEMQIACASIDEFVLRGFESQPFMKGISPKLAEKLLRGPPPIEITAGMRTWVRGSSDCVECETIASFYQQTIAPRPDWRKWLAAVDERVLRSDAVLLPLLVGGYVDRSAERGISSARRLGSVAIMLISTETGRLIWVGGRVAEVSKKAFTQEIQTAPLPAPPWDDLKARLLTEDIWRGFPGRQTTK